MKAFGFCAGGGGEEPVLQGQKQWELERMSKLGPTVPAWSGVQNQGKAEQGESSAKLSLALPALLGMCLQRGREGSQRAHSCQGGGREPVEAS